MTYRQKILLGVALGLIGLLVILYAFSHVILLRSYERLETQDILEHVARARDAVLDDIADLDRQASDWAGWNETYTFAGGTNPDYIEQNLPDETYADLRLNLFAVTDRQGRLIYGGMYDPAAEEVLPLPDSLKAHLTFDRLLRHDTTNSHIEGLLLLPEGPLLIASRPVLRTDRTGPLRGALLMGRYLDAREVARLAAITHLTLRVEVVGAPERPDDPAFVRRPTAAAFPHTVRRLGPQIVE